MLTAKWHSVKLLVGHFAVSVEIYGTFGEGLHSLKIPTRAQESARLSEKRCGRVSAKITYCAISASGVSFKYFWIFVVCDSYIQMLEYLTIIWKQVVPITDLRVVTLNS